MLKIFPILFFIGLSWSQNAHNLIEDISHYNSGNLKYKRFYQNGNAHGKWSHFYDNENIWIEGYYNNGIKVGLWTTYHKNGQGWTKGSYMDNERSGKWIFYNEDGTIFEDKEY